MTPREQGAREDGGPAFPQPMATSHDGTMYVSHEKHPDWGGMTLRDYVAIAVVAALYANPRDDFRQTREKNAAEAYAQADAMLAERDR